jgi:serine/threonine protein kinase
MSSAAIISGEQFLRNLADSGLLAEDALAALPIDVDSGVLAQQLVDTGKLTSFQTQAVRERRFNELHVGSYEVLDQLGRGGMGTVYKARHRRMKRTVALKVLAPGVANDSEFLQRFQREVETIAKLSHPNIVMAYDAAEDEIGHYLVMEFIDGRDLASEVNNGGPLSVAEAVSCTLQAARGLEYAHRQGIIHRDIKPANLLRDGSGTVKVADLGLARLSTATGAPDGGTALTVAGGILGTADFMPPEQALDSTTIDHRADIYSLGCTLFFLLTGRPVYRSGSLMGLLLQHRDAPAPSLIALRADTPATLDAIFRRAVAKDPANRFQTMTEMREALESLHDVGSLTTRPTPVDNASAAVQPTILEAKPPEAQEGGSAATIVTARPAAEVAVVLVEPSRTQAAIVRSYLQQLKVAKVHFSSTGQQAIALVKQAHAQVVISAMHLTDMTGMQLAEAIHADHECSAVGFILASSEADSDATGAFARHPRNVLMPKPFDLHKLAEALACATGRPVGDFK